MLLLLVVTTCFCTAWHFGMRRGDHRAQRLRALAHTLTTTEACVDDEKDGLALFFETRESILLAQLAELRTQHDQVVAENGRLKELAQAAGHDFVQHMLLLEDQEERHLHARALLTWVAEALDAPPVPVHAAELRAHVSAFLATFGAAEYADYFQVS